MPKLQMSSPGIVSLYLTFCLVLVTPITSKAELTANIEGDYQLQLLGIGVHQELRNDIYVGALFAPSSVDKAEDLLNDNIAKRMSVRFVTDYSARKLSRHWKERLAMNNARNDWRPLTKEIVDFSSIFKRGMEAGDELNIDHVPGSGTHFYLNGTLFKKIETNGLMNLILNVWLGTTPPTKAFKKTIRGEMAASDQAGLETRYLAFAPLTGKFDDDLAPTTQVAKADTSAAEKSTKSKTPKATTNQKKSPVTIAKKETAPPAKKQPVKTKTQVADNSKPSSNITKTLPADTVGSLAKVDIAKPKLNLGSSVASNSSDNKDQKPEQAAQAESAVTKTASLEQPKQQKEEEFFDADLLSGSYTRDLINEIRQYQEYPRKALMSGDEGDVVALVSIDAEGELIDLEIIESSGSRILDRAVSRMIRKAAPYTIIPPELKLQKYDFEVPISFKL